MMKKLLLLSCALAMVASVATSQIRFGIQATGADLDIGKKLGLQGLGDNPGTPATDSFGFELVDIYAFGYGGGIHVDFNLPLILAIRVQGDYVTFTPNETKYRDILKTILPHPPLVSELWVVEGGRINGFTVFASAKLNPLPLPIVSPYISGGIGLANISRSEATLKYDGAVVTKIPGTDAITSTSANAGLGVDIDLAGTTLYVEARLTWIFTEGGTTSMLPLGSIGVTF